MRLKNASTRIVFLDIDGVLNSRDFVQRASSPNTPGPDLLAPEGVARLEQFCVEHGAAVVVSSTWRLSFDRATLTNMLRNKGLRETALLDYTPLIPHKRGRGQEIQAWLDSAREPIDGVVILDDEPDMLHLMPWLAQSSFETGLTDSHLAVASRILSAPPPTRNT